MRATRLGSIGVSLFAAWCLAASASSLFAQVAAGEITGVVTDPAGAAVPGATVTLTNVQTNLQRVLVSSGEGVYTAPSLAPGDYRIDVELPGFKPIRREGRIEGDVGAAYGAAAGLGVGPLAHSPIGRGLKEPWLRPAWQMVSRGLGG